MLLPDWESLPLAEQVAQMVVVRASGHLFDQQIEYPAWEPPQSVLQHWVQDLKVGGVLLLGGSAAAVRLRTHQLQEWASIPLLIAADIEEGVGQRFAGATWFPPPMAISGIAQPHLGRAVAYAEQMGATTAQEALAIGINWILAPVVDVNNNPANPVINVRAWGNTPVIISSLTTAFLRGAKAYPVLTTAKHFPGHGDTEIDSHLELPTLPHSLARLAEIEFPPFQAAIAAGVDTVMTAHLRLPALDTDYPATLSSRVGNQIRQWGFDGLIVTDALVMGAITQRYGANEAPVLAVEAGADVILMPIDPEGAIQAICAAVDTGRITSTRIHESLNRLWRAKAALNQATDPAPGNAPHAWEQLPPPAVPMQFLSELAQPQAQATAAAILTESMQVYQPPDSRLRQPKGQTQCRNLILVDDLLNSPFLSKQAPAITYPQSLGYSLQRVDRHTPGAAHLETADQEAWQPTLVQIFMRGNPFRGSAGLSPLVQDWLTVLVETQQLQAVILYGSPYALTELLPLLPPDVPYVFSYGQMAMAQTLALKALFSAEPESQFAGDRAFTD